MLELPSGLMGCGPESDFLCLLHNSFTSRVHLGVNSGVSFVGRGLKVIIF
jgi:hypothetical protein